MHSVTVKGAVPGEVRVEGSESGAMLAWTTCSLNLVLVPVRLVAPSGGKVREVYDGGIRVLERHVHGQMMCEL